MKSRFNLPFFVFFILISFLGNSQDYSVDRWYDSGSNTNINLPAYGKLSIVNNAQYSQEEVLKIQVSDAPNDFLKIRNATTLDNKFIPWIIGSNQTDLRESLFISGFTNYNYDYGTEPIVVFDARKYTDTENLTDGSQIENRALFSWRSYIYDYMLLSAQGYLGIGTTSPQAQLHTTGSVRFSGLSSGTGSYTLTTDFNGNLLKTSIPSGSSSAFISSTQVINSLPRFGASNVLVNSQVFDNGTNIGIGGQPANDAKVTVYGVVNTLSDAREKENFERIEGAVEKVNHLNGYYYDWKNTDDKQVGLVAQEVEKVLPEAVSENESGTKFLNYDGVTPLLVEAIKEQQKQLEQQAKQIELLQNEISKLSRKRNRKNANCK